MTRRKRSQIHELPPAERRIPKASLSELHGLSKQVAQTGKALVRALDESVTLSSAADKVYLRLMDTLTNPDHPPTWEMLNEYTAAQLGYQECIEEMYAAGVAHAEATAAMLGHMTGCLLILRAMYPHDAWMAALVRDGSKPDENVHGLLFELVEERYENEDGTAGTHITLTDETETSGNE